MRCYLLILSLFFCGISFAQNTITGTVTETNGQPIPGVNVKIVGDKGGTVTDADGKFTLTSKLNPPFTLEITSLGHQTKKVNVASNNQNVAIKLVDSETTLDEVVVAASRAPERVMESPVTIERMGLKEIKRTASPTFYDGLENMKEVQMNSSSLTFKSINTRGFATVANTRFMQLVDGMDNSSPLLNFVLGNMIGVSDIDVQSVELLPGASSALYGANAFNGIMFMNSKSPFTYQGISTYLKYGATSQEAAGTNSFYDFGIRMAHTFNKYFAAKANFTYMQGTDWFAVNYDDKTRQGEGITRSDVNYDGINVYGDEASTNIKAVGQALAERGLIPAAAVNLLPNYNVSRTGYNEVDLTNNRAGNTKIDYSFYLRPLGDERLEVIWQSKFGFGNAVYQGANRYYLNNFYMSQHKLEVKGKNFFVRGYTTTEDGGESYDMQFTGLNVNRKWKDDTTWFGQYAGTFVQATLAGQTPESAHIMSRKVADTGRYLPGTPEFKNAFNTVIADPDVLTGSKLVDNSRIYHADVNYNFRDIIKYGEIQLGGSYRQYELNSFGRIYTDDQGPIYYDEYGVYAQFQKKYLEDRLKFTGSVRYDKSQNFDGSFSPRVSFVYAGGANKQHNFRASYQTGFRNPSTQDQYIGFNVGSAVLIGSAPDNLLRYSETRPVANGSPAVGQIYAGGSSVTITGENAYQNSYTRASVNEFAAFLAANPGNTPGAAKLLKVTNVSNVKPEEVQAIELGYRSQYEGVNIDLNGYYNTYNNFIGNTVSLAPLYGTVSETFDFAQGAPSYVTNPAVQTLHALGNGNFRAFQLYTNTDLKIQSFGIGIGLSKRMFGYYDFGINYNYAQFDFDQAKDPGFEAGFNTPKHKIRASIGNEKLFENFGFNVSVRWNTEYLWESTMVDGMIESATVLDAQVNYGLPKLKSLLKLGATNLGGQDYIQVLGAGAIGQQYYISWTINP
ncbi:TonB-dependent receptor domain-containing protein [Flavobacterium sp.]|jgi:outer membrane receptor protein involved in Fe transport|uniref:TonB-dependent receptor domain-containing protein n=1 Tax=Flavobacterium sp. TaxID=239 RepID=UPI0037C049E3